MTQQITMEKEQQKILLTEITAVEWLMQNIENTLPNFIEAWRVEYEQAKQMEKVNNEYSWIAGAEYSISVLKDKTLKESKESFEQYYNETYNK